MKKIFLSAYIILSVIFIAAASPAAINFDNLPKDEKFQTLFLDFGNAYYSISYSDFNNKDAKKNDLKAANALYSYLKKKKKANYDERLLKLLAGRCLYNYDEISFSDVENDFNALEKDFPENAEHHWIYGNFLVSAGKTLEGKNELEKYMDMKNYYIGSFFIENYAYAQHMCDMPFNAYYTMTNGGSIPEENIQNQELLGIIKNHIKESSSQEEYETKQVWRLSQEENGYYYLYSTMLGISFPIKGSWVLNYKEFFEGNPAMCMLKIDGFNLNEKPGSISFLMMVYPQSFNPDASKDKLINSFNIIKKETEEINKKNFDKYTYEDLSKYNDARKGSRGYIYTATIKPGKWAAVKCEHPVDLSQLKGNSGEIGYFAITPSQNRLQEPVTVIMLIDSCNAFIEQTDDLLKELFSKAIFD